MGSFTSKHRQRRPRPSKIKHGVVVVATGATEHKPQTYGYGKSDES